MLTNHHHLTGDRAGTIAVGDRCAAVVGRFATWLTPTERMQVQLGLHELIVNIDVHAYGGRGGTIEVTFSVDHDAVRIDVADSGARLRGPVRRDLPEHPSTGGYGLPILTAVFDDVTYCRHAGRNRWSLEIRRATGRTGS